ncbi:hypothetical protein ACFO3J_01665 [Streptomyces polygonati]|uniref:Uncharacterized protein n=1 Tax=Streptomyces polygonati TaxID=1617087 RepID=A0ABV8HH93_9ACTN
MTEPTQVRTAQAAPEPPAPELSAAEQPTPESPAAESAAPGESPVAEPPLAPDLPAKAPRRKLRAVLRWTSAVLVFAALGGASAYAVTQPERTKIPGLKTPDDGRWTYPPIALPKLPAGKPRALDMAANPGGHHYVDLRSLLLPGPLTASAEPALPGKTGWLPVGAFLEAYSLDPDLTTLMRTTLKDEGLRHIAAEGWTMPDGTRTQVYLLQYLSTAYAGVSLNDVEADDLKGVEDADVDNTVASKVIPSEMNVNAYAERKPDAEDTRYAYIRSGDVLALVEVSRTGGLVPEAPFSQTVRLQAQLLG